MVVKAWNTIKAAKIGAMFGIPGLFIQNMIHSESFPVETTELIGFIIGGIIGGALLFSGVAALRNFWLRAQ